MPLQVKGYGAPMRPSRSVTAARRGVKAAQACQLQIKNYGAPMRPSRSVTAARRAVKAAQARSSTSHMR